METAKNMITKVTFQVPVAMFYQEDNRVGTQPRPEAMTTQRTINGCWQSIDEAFEAACNAGGIPDKQMKYEYN